MTPAEYRTLIAAGLSAVEALRLAHYRARLYRVGHGHPLATPDVLRARRERWE